MNEYAEPGELIALSRPSTEKSQHEELLQLARDLVSPEGYGWAIPQEVVKRAAEILRMRQPPGVGR